MRPLFAPCRPDEAHMWFDESVFYQIYPLGFCGAERENDFGGVRHRLGRIEKEIPRLKALGVGAVLLNPLFESVKHGYDTVDFFTVDRRLGTNDDLKHLVRALHEAGIRVVLDGVFNHVGRKFPPFEEVLREREKTDKRFWFNIDFHGDSPYHDGLGYENWEGHAELVKLRLDCEAVQTYLMDAVRFWIREFGIDGLRLDVAYLLPPWFLELLRRTVKEEKADFFLMGEVVHLTNYRFNVCPERLDSITNYEGFRSMISAFNSRNLHEIEYSLTRLFGSFEWCLFRGKNLFSFVDNHDVERAATALRERRNLFNLYTLLFTMPGIPCVYYGSEFGAEGDKSDHDYRLRPCIDDLDRAAFPALTAHIAKLAGIRSHSRVLAYGSYRKLAVQGTSLAFEREWEGERLVAALNIDGADCTLRLTEGEGEDLFSGERCSLAALTLPPYSARLLRL